MWPKGLVEATRQSHAFLPGLPRIPYVGGNAFDPESIQSAFHTLAVVRQTLAAASRLIDLMPGNQKWVADSEATMEARVAIGANRSFVLKNALLLYSDGTTMFATLHSVMMRAKNSAPHLGPGQALTMTFLKTLAEGLGARIAAEILPDNVLARTPDMITWWTRARREVMFFGGVDPEARTLDGATYPYPPLVLKVTSRELFVRALEADERPTGETPLRTAPYWNCDSAGRVCLGSMPVPDETTADSIAGWQSGFFRSQFTHANGAVRLTNHPQGFVGLWKSLKDSQHPFPTKLLADAKETFRQFVERG